MINFASATSILTWYHRNAVQPRVHTSSVDGWLVNEGREGAGDYKQTSSVWVLPARAVCMGIPVRSVLPLKEEEEKEHGQ